MWNRIQDLVHCGAQLDVIATVKELPPPEARRAVEEQVHSLDLIVRRPLRSGILSFKPVQVAIRSDLKHITLQSNYDIVIMQTEYTAEILQNPTLKAQWTAIRVENDEASYQLAAARATQSWKGKLYCLQEALRVKLYSARAFSRVNALWFISQEEQARYKQHLSHAEARKALFLPSGVDLRKMKQPPLTGQRVLFVGSLSVAFNQQAITWYIHNVHARLAHVSGYHLVVAGSSRGKDMSWLHKLAAPFPNIDVRLDVPDLEPLYDSSAVFINPMKNGFGVKLKTVEAVLHGLPIVSTNVGVEGTGLEAATHFTLANDPLTFAEAVRKLLLDKNQAHAIVKRAQKFLGQHYGHGQCLQHLLVPAPISNPGE